jgi:hypothetical protein
VLNKKVISHGMHVTIEHDKGSKRILYDDDGKLVYKKHMFYPYGYFTNTKGRDGDDVDCFLGPLTDAKFAYVIHMKDLGPDKAAREDEDKCMLGFGSEAEAKQAFLLHYKESFFGGMSVIPIDEFRKKLKTASLPYRRKKITAVTRAFVGLLVCAAGLFAQRTTITGTFRYPDATPVSGRVTIQLLRNGSYTCVLPAQIIASFQVTVAITAGSLGTLSLYPNSCLTPVQNYIVTVYDQNGNQLYKGAWLVPQQTTADVTVISYVAP